MISFQGFNETRFASQKIVLVFEYVWIIMLI